ncbi:MAG: penicillin-binding protein 2 [Candidatus Magasanikbacteria bacterium RIFOXYD2_FULL_41_14]|uniref:Penicillin-binding protein 2 n=1 Tax=Candidatus Magasanikbacteria bacterium RIFOXYD2_FULL_41_14 TaxID=1798709 RepID=A0A1F6PBY6_9BACT|nr:MAG: penicillin-binding protein 2 [Candidatus Magasanikbacteria bacterium RIFOXYD2_FULL_41_14]
MADLWNNPDSNAASYNRLKGRYRRDWIEESFHNENPAGEKNGTRDFLGDSIEPNKIIILAILILLGAFGLLTKTFYLQIINGSKYLVLAENNRVRIKPIPSERGIIFDRDGKQLVQNIPSFSLNIAPQEIPKDPATRQKIIDGISATTDLPYEEIEALLYKYRNNRSESIEIKGNLDYNSALKLYVKNADLPGVSIESGIKRDYLYSHLENQNNVLSLSHVLGYLGKLNDDEQERLQASGYLLSDNIGRTGLEKQYENYLRGTYGIKKIEVDAVGREQNVISEEAPIPGDNLIMTIDIEAQAKLEELVKKSAHTNGKQKISAVAINPQTGGVLAIVSWPAYSDNLFAEGINRADYDKLINDKNEPLFNRAVAGVYPSGSTIKPVISAAALEEGIITKNSSFLSVGGLQVGDHYFKDWKAGGHGMTNVISAIAWSVNTFFYYIGGGYGSFHGLGVEKIAEYLRKFNLGSTTGIDIPGEAAGFVPDSAWKEKTKNEPWYVGDTYNLSIGQGDLLVTPLQVAVWTASIANGGNLIKPHLVNKINDSNGNTIFQATTTPKQTNLISASSDNIVREGMRQCVISGSCQLLKYLPFSSGAKTGTAQWNSTKPTHAWFTAFAPFDYPQITIAVLIEEGGEGATTAMPIAKDWLAWWGQKYLTP